MTLDNPYATKYAAHKRLQYEERGLYTQLLEKRGLDRVTLCRRYSWAVPTEQDIELILDYAPKLVEIGAGTGYWAYLLRQLSGNVLAFDIQPYRNKYANGQWSHVRQGDAEITRKYPDRALFLCWPNYATATAYDALVNWLGDTVIYIGEGFGGCTGDDAFHAVLEKEFHLIEEQYILHYWGINDTLCIYRRF